MTENVKVLVVDDSQTMRRLIRAALEMDHMITVVGEAEDAPSARDFISAHKVDVVTLDIEMPGMSGLEFLRRIMRHRPMPVIMVSSLTRKGTSASVEALASGAFACVAKPDMRMRGKPFEGLTNLVRAAARANLLHGAVRRKALKPAVVNFKPNKQIVAIGASIGGVEALTVILSAFPENCPPTLITQHMPEGYTENFAERLDRMCAPKVQQAADGAPIRTGHVYLAPGGNRHLEFNQTRELTCRLVPGEKVSGHSPSIDQLFHSFAAIGARALGVILTGMGKDGASGLLEMRKAGAHTIGQTEETCVVYGIAKAAHANGAVAEQVPLDQIAKRILTHCNT